MPILLSLLISACSLQLHAQYLDFIPEGTFPVEIYSPSDIYGPSYPKIQQSMQQLADASDLVTLINIGESVEGRVQTGVLIKSPNIVNTKMVLVTGAIHGHEYLNIADRLLFKFADKNIEAFQNFLNQGGSFFVLPIHNVDGYELGKRRNQNRKDLNRDFPNSIIGHIGHTQPESTNLSHWVNQYLDTNNVELRFVMDYHCCLGSLLYPIAYSETERLPPMDLEDHLKIVNLMYNHFSQRYSYGTPMETIGYTATGTTLDYWYLTRNALTFTFEGQYKIEDDNLEKHNLWFQEIVQLL